MTKTPDNRPTKSHDLSHDKGQSPRRSLPDITLQQLGTDFRDFMNLETFVSPSKTGYTGHDESLVFEEKPANSLDTSLTWPSPNSSFLVSGSPITVGSPGRDREPDSDKRYKMLSPLVTRQARPGSAVVRMQSPSPNRGRSFSVRNRERSWSPPRCKDRSFDIPSSKSFGHLETDSFSLPDMPGKFKKDSQTRELSLALNAKPSTAVTITVSSASSLSDTSSTITSSAPPTNRDSGIASSDPRRFPRGQSPPVRDSGSSLTTVTSLPGQDSPRDRRLSFDIGFVDILTMDSNSSIVEQLSSGRVSAPVVSDLLFSISVVMGDI